MNLASVLSCKRWSTSSDEATLREKASKAWWKLSRGMGGAFFTLSSCKGRSSHTTVKSSR